ncbi:MAG: sigma-70 family RNA polymerase sigma factor [Chloroflexi bacterium]|nr:sigma-70 family RNA polymerase sigma factor [Chloroflexota bacterium]
MRGQTTEKEAAESPSSRRRKAAFAETYQAYYPRVFAFVYSRVGDVDRTKDLTAEIFERAYTKGHTVREAKAYPTWLFTIARNVIIADYREQKRQTEGQKRLGRTPQRAEPGPEERTLSKERTRTLMALMLGLPERDRQLLSLKFEGELSYAEIAQVMGITVVNARVGLFRALRRLRDLMVAETGWP